MTCEIYRRTQTRCGGTRCGEEPSLRPEPGLETGLSDCTVMPGCWGQLCQALGLGDASLLSPFIWKYTDPQIWLLPLSVEWEQGGGLFFLRWTHCDSVVLISHASKGMLKILQARLQQYANQELPDVQAGFQRGRGTRDQIANICFIIEKAREFQKNIYFCFTDYTKAFVWITANCRKFFKRPPYLSPKKAGCGSRRNRTGCWTPGSKLGKEYNTAVYCLFNI